MLYSLGEFWKLIFKLKSESEQFLVQVKNKNNDDREPG